MADDVAVDSAGSEQGTLDGVTESGGTAAEGGGPKETYTRDEYAKLQKENQSYREKWGQYEKTYSNPDAQLFHQVAQAYTNGDMDTVAAWMIQNTAALKGADAEALTAFLEGGGDPADLTDDAGEQPLTRAEVQAMLNEREQTFEQRQTQAQVREIWAAAEDLGYKQGTREFVDLLHIATNDTGGDLEKAHAQLESEKQAIIDQYLQAKRDDANGVIRPTAGQAPANARKVTMDNARELAEEFIANNS